MKNNKKLNKIISLILFMSLLFQNVYGLSLVHDKNNPNILRVIGLGYYDLWQDSRGHWENNIEPGSKVTLDLSYSFGSDLIPRNIVNVTVKDVDLEDKELSKIWDQSRVPDDSYFERKPQSVYKKIVKDYTADGTNTRHTNITVKVETTLVAEEPMKHPTEGLAPGVQGRRYYIPLLIEIEVEPEQHDVLIQHFNADTGTRLAENETLTVKLNEKVTASKKDFSPLLYHNVKISYDGGKSWAETLTDTSVSRSITKDTIIRFYYGGEKKGDLSANLELTANPAAIEKDKKEAVAFTLDGSKSTAKQGIVKYEYWLSNNENFNVTPDFTSTKAVQLTTKSNVEANTTWYAKLQITDSKGAKDIAFATITIGEYSPIPDAVAKADLKLNAVRNTPRILDFRAEEDSRFVDSSGTTYGYEYYLDIFVPESQKNEYGEYEPSEIDITLSGADSTSTNGIGKYAFTLVNTGQTIYSGSSASTSNIEAFFTCEPQDVKNGNCTNDYWHHNTVYELEVTDSVDSRAKNKMRIEVYVKYFFEEDGESLEDNPTVKLAINENTFIRQETAYFTPTYKKENLITNKSWEIYSTTNTFTDSGTGEIPKSYYLDIPTGFYVGKQTIYYLQDGQLSSSSAEVAFEVRPLLAPQVTLATDKEKYIVPDTVKFLPTFVESSKHYPINKKTWLIKNPDGSILQQGTGNIPNRVFDISSIGGNYTAEQTIYWTEYGKEFTSTATCQFKIVSPIPNVDFKVDMKMSDTPSWNRIDVTGQTGKQYKQIRIDLSPAADIQDADNPYPILFNSLNTQIQVLPLTDNNDADRGKNSTIQTPVASDKYFESNTLTFKGKQYIDVRFDSPGKYRIKVRVANQYYVSSWVVRDIIIREDLPPITTLTFEDVAMTNNQYTVYRNTSDLRVLFKVLVDAQSQDDDLVDFTNSKLEIRYDYNSDGDSSNDGVHSQMYVTQNNSNLQSYISVNRNYDLKTYDVNMFSSSFPILGKIRFEYSIGKIPTIPYFIDSNMPNIPTIMGTTYSLPMEQKIVFADNIPGNIKIELGKESKIEITIIMGADTLHFDLNTLKAYYGESAKIYVVDKNGNRELVS